MGEREIIKVSESTLPEDIHKCSVCCCGLNDNISCSKFEFMNGFDCCHNNKHFYQEKV